MIIKMIIRSSQDEQPAYFYTKLLGWGFFSQNTTIKIYLFLPEHYDKNHTERLKCNSCLSFQIFTFCCFLSAQKLMIKQVFLLKGWLEKPLTSVEVFLCPAKCLLGFNSKSLKYSIKNNVNFFSSLLFLHPYQVWSVMYWNVQSNSNLEFPQACPHVR